MQPPAERDLILEDILAFNDALLALAATGLPVELAAGESNATLQRKLPQINARLALQVSRGQSLAQALADDPDVTPHYRVALEDWRLGQQPIEALEALSAAALGRREVESTARFSLVYPLIVLILVYAGFVYLLLSVLPKLEAVYAQVWEAPGPALAALVWARDWLPLWGPLLPLLIVLAATLWALRRVPLGLAWLPGRTRYLDALHKANYADSLALLIEKNQSLGQALALLGPLPAESPNAQAYAAANARLIEAEQQGERVAADDPKVQALPAVLRWIFTGDLLGQPMPEVLRVAARNYRATAGQHFNRLRWWVPTLVGALVGGVLVLGFALSLFWPVVELLETLTHPLKDFRHAGLRL